MALSLEAKVIIGLAIGAAGIGVVVLSSKPSSQAAPKNSPAPNASSVGQQREGFFPTQPIASWAVTLSPGDMGSMDVNLGDSIQLYTPDGESIYSVLSAPPGVLGAPEFNSDATNVVMGALATGTAQINANWGDSASVVGVRVLGG